MANEQPVAPANMENLVKKLSSAAPNTVMGGSTIYPGEGVPPKRTTEQTQER